MQKHATRSDRKSLDTYRIIVPQEQPGNKNKKFIFQVVDMPLMWIMWTIKYQIDTHNPHRLDNYNSSYPHSHNYDYYAKMSSKPADGYDVMMETVDN